MKISKLVISVFSVVLMTAVGSVQASSLWLESKTPHIFPGDTIELEVHMDFSDDPTIGGGFDIIFDPSIVSYNSNSYITDTALGSDPSFTRDDNPTVPPANRVEVRSDRLAGAAFGKFDGLSGPAMVGPLSFTRIASGIAVFDLGPSTSDAVGGFFNERDFVEQFPDYFGVTIVPVPAAVWLFGSGFLGFIGIARRKKAS